MTRGIPRINNQATVLEQLRLKKKLRKLVSGGLSRQDAARVVGVGYDCALQWTRTMEVVQKYVHTSDKVGIDDYEPYPAIEPTTTLCGTMERIEVYRARVENGEHLYHPWDIAQQAERDCR